MGGDEGSHWQTWGSPLASTALKLAGLGLTANRGAAGPPLAYLGDVLSGARQAGIESQAGRRFEDLMQPRERSTELPGTGDNPMDVEGASSPKPNARRTWHGEPTGAEAFQALSQMQGVADPVRQVLLDMVRRTRFPSEVKPPTEVDRERDLAQRTMERRDLGGATQTLLGEQNVPEGQATAARGVIEKGGQPHVQIPPRLEQQEKAFNAQVAEAYPGGITSAEDALKVSQQAREAGLDAVADRIEKQWRLRRDVAEDRRATGVRETLLPKWRTQLEGLRQQGVSSTTLAGLESALDSVDEMPSSRNVGAVNRAFASVAKMEDDRKKFEKRLAVYQQRVNQLGKGRNAAVQASQATALLREITREIAQLNTMQQTHPDPVARAHAAEQVQMLQAQQGELRDYLLNLQGGEGMPGGEPGPGPRGGAQPDYTIDEQGKLVPSGAR